MESMEAIGMNEVAFLLSKIQNEIKVNKNQFNAFGKYKYRSVEDIQVAVKPICLKYESSIILTDETFEVCGIPVVKATAKFMCPFGELSVSASAGVELQKKGMDFGQAFGSASSYARKYAMSGLLLLDDVADADATNNHSKTEVRNLISATDAQVDKAIADGKAQQVLNLSGVKYQLTNEQITKLKSAI